LSRSCGEIVYKKFLISTVHVQAGRNGCVVLVVVVEVGKDK